MGFSIYRSVFIILFIATSASAETAVTPAETAPPPPPASRGLMNPDTGVNFLGLYRKSVSGNDSAAANPNGFSFQEAEIQFSADVDPYLRAVALFSIGETASTSDATDSNGDTVTVDIGHEFGIEPEEVFLETIQLPGVTLRAGKFKTALGRHNGLHTHAYPFIDAPLVNTTILGEEGLNAMGVSAAALIPTPWFLELTLQALSRNTEFFEGTSPNSFPAVGQLKNLWELSDSSTVELNFFGASGKNEINSTSRVYGADLTYKWRPEVGGKYQSLTWTSEYMRGKSVSSGAFERNAGVASWIQYQFAERWWAQVRAEYLGIARSSSASQGRKQSALIGFFPSEFSGFRLQYDHTKMMNQPVDHGVALQWNISIGAHPAHNY